MGNDTQSVVAEQYPAHPAASIFPVMDGEQFAILKQDIQAHGQRELIVLFQQQILDGRNRDRACRELGIKPDYCDLEECDDPIAYVISANLARRHLSKSERAAIAAEHLPHLKAAAADRKVDGQKSGGRGRKKTIGKKLPIVSAAGKAVEQAAKLVDVSPEYVRQAARLKEQSPELHEQVQAGKLSLPAAKRKAQYKCPNCGGGQLDEDGDACAACKEPHAPAGLSVYGGDDTAGGVQRALDRRGEFAAIVTQVGRLVSSIETLAKTEAGTFLAERLPEIKTDLRNAQRAVKFCTPHQVCPYCSGKGCESTDGRKAPCRGTGWTIRGVKGGGQ